MRVLTLLDFELRAAAPLDFVLRDAELATGTVVTPLILAPLKLAALVVVPVLAPLVFVLPVFAPSVLVLRDAIAKKKLQTCSKFQIRFFGASVHSRPIIDYDGSLCWAILAHGERSQRFWIIEREHPAMKPGYESESTGSSPNVSDSQGSAKGSSRLWHNFLFSRCRNQPGHQNRIGTIRQPAIVTLP